MNATSITMIIAMLVLLALAVAIGLQFNQGRTESQVAAARTMIRELQQEQQQTAPPRRCVTCGQELDTPV